MTNPFNPAKGFIIVDRADYDVKQLSDTQYDGLMSDDEDALLLESVTLEDLEHAYLGDHLTDRANTAMYEAVSTTKQRLAQTMRAFVRILNRGLNGTGIIAGTHDAGLDETGGATVGGAQIGNVRRVAGVPVMVAKIPCTDGQSISLIFHSPTSDGTKLVGLDSLVAFKFLLNSRDVTHVVAPIGGRDISLDQTAQSLSNLLEKNSAKFTKQQKMHSSLKMNAEAAENEANTLEQQAADEMTHADSLNASVTNTANNLANAKAALARAQAANQALETQIAELKQAQAQKIADKVAADSGTAVEVTPPATDSELAIEAEAEQRPVEQADSQKFYYGLKARPNWKPQGAVEQYTADEAAELDFIKLKGGKPNDYRYGAVAYDKPLPADKISDYELVDFQAIITAEEAQQTLGLLNPLIADFKRDNPEGTDKDFLIQYLKGKSRDADKVPEPIRHAGFMKLLRIVALAQNITQPKVLASLFDAVPAADALVQTHDSQETTSQEIQTIDPLPTPVETKPDTGPLPTSDDSQQSLPGEEQITPPENPKTVVEQPEAAHVEAETAPEQPQEKESEVSEVDQAAQQGVNYMNGLLSFQSTDPTAIDVEMAKVENIAATLTDAGKMEENEDLLNRVADHLVGLSVAIAQGIKS